MKKMLLLLFAFLVLSSAVYAYSPDSSYVALYADTLRSGWRVNRGGGAVTPFELWIWWLPSVRGIRAAEFRIIYPTSVIQGTVTASDSLSIQFGTLPNGMAVSWIYCQHDWAWSHHQDIYLKDANPAQIMVSTSNASGKLQIVWCPPVGAPIEPVRKWNNFCLNYDCGTAVHSRSWGAIKDLYK